MTEPWQPLYPDVALARELAAIGTPALPSLHALMGSEEQNRVWDAVFCAGMIGDAMSVAPLISAGHRGPHPIVAVAICDALAATGSSDALPYLEYLVRAAPPQVDVFADGHRSKHQVVRWAAAGAIEQLTGLRPHFKGESWFGNVGPTPPPQHGLPESLEWANRSWIVDGGEWQLVLNGEALLGRGTGRLWLKTPLPTEYDVSLAVFADRGQAGLSFGHLKDFVPALARGGWLDLEVSRSAVLGITSRGGTMSEVPLMLTWRSCAVRSRADLGPRLGLFVDNASAQFWRFTLGPLTREKGRLYGSSEGQAP